jgi:hypothetical protein
MKLKAEINQKIFTPEVEKAFTALAESHSYKAIAIEQEKSEETIKSYAKIIREEFHAKTIMEATLKAVARGVISIKEVGKTLAITAIVLASVTDDDYRNFRRHERTKITVSRNKNEA